MQLCIWVDDEENQFRNRDDLFAWLTGWGESVRKRADIVIEYSVEERG